MAFNSSSHHIHPRLPASFSSTFQHSDVITKVMELCYDCSELMEIISTYIHLSDTKDLYYSDKVFFLSFSSLFRYKLKCEGFYTYSCL